MRKINIAILFNSQTPTHGGSYSLVSSIVEGFIEVRNEALCNITLVSVGKSKNELADFNFKPENKILRLVRNILTFRSTRLMAILQSKSKLAKFLLQKKIDVVYYLGIPAEITSIPFIMNVWDLQHRTHPWFPELNNEKSWQDRESYYKRHLPRALAVITGTPQGKNEVHKIYGVDESNIYIIPHVISKNSDSEIDKVSGSRVGPYIYPAQFWAHKNHNIIVQAVKIIRDTMGKEVKVNFIGDDKGNLGYIKKIIEDAGLNNQIKILGFVSNDVKTKLYNESKGLIYSSFSGPENLPPLEAFDAGIPVIYSDFPGAREQLGDFPYYFDPLSPISLVQAIQQVENQDKDDLASRLTAQKIFVNNKRPFDFTFLFIKMINRIELMINAWDKRDFPKF